MKISTEIAFALILGILVTVNLHAAVYTVGLNGSYSSIQDAIDAALAAGGDNYIKIRNSTFDEVVGIPTSMNSGSLTLSGGWNAFFAYQDDPSTTLINPSASSPAGSSAVVIENTGGEVGFENLTIMGGNAPGDGGGVYILAQGSSRVAFRHCIIRDNTTQSSGGGLSINVHDTVAVEFEDCSIRQNHSAGDGYDLAGGGVYAYFSGSSSLKMSFCSIVDNEVASTVSPHAVDGGGLFLMIRDNAQAIITDSVFSDNSMGSLSGDKDGSACSIVMDEGTGSPNLEARRNFFRSSSAIAASSLFYFYSSNAVSAEISDSCFAKGSGKGIQAYSSYSASLIFNNLTVTGVTGTGVEVTGFADTLVSLTNTIIWDTGNDTPVLPTSSLSSGNLTGTDPHFVATARDDYSLLSDSAAIDIGNNTPAGGLAEVDLNRLQRLIGSTVDAGACEWGGIFGDGFEVADTRYWSSSTP